MQIKEIQIPMPWGFVAAKTWGDEHNTAVLAVHGVVDNAGTFDQLIPLLPDHFFYICIDLPGHGKSSHFPPHITVYTPNNLIVYKLTMEYFEKEKYIIMGHSWGGQIGILFTQLYPEMVEKLILFDSVHLFPVSVPHFESYLRGRIEDFLTLESKLANRKPPSYTYDEALEKIRDQRLGNITTETAKSLLDRSLVPTETNGKFQFCFDQKVKFFINPLHDMRYAVESLKRTPINCPVLLVLAKESKPKTAFRPLLEIMGKQKNWIIKYLDGDHDIHSNQPEIVAPLVNKFLRTQKSKL